MAQTVSVIVSAEERVRLAAIVGDRSRPLKHVQRARIVLHSADRLPVLEVAHRASVSRPAVWRWQRRYAEEGVEGLLHDKTRPPGTAPVPMTTVAKVLALTCAEPPGETTHWTGRAMAAAVGLSLRTIQRIWEAHRLQPHRLRTFKRSKDPAFAEKVEDIVGLYMRPPAHAVVLSREVSDPSSRPNPAGPAAQTRQVRDHDTRLQAPRHDHPVRRLQRARRRGARSLHAEAYPSRVHPLPQRRRTRGPCWQADPRHCRQLRNPQAPQGPSLAHPSSALDLPFHPDLQLLAQRRRKFLLRSDPQAPATRGLPLHRRSASRHQPLPQ